MRKMSELYEIWSVFQVTDLILPLLVNAGYQIISSQGFFKVRDDQFHFEVDRDARIELAKDERRVVIRYEPRYPPANEVVAGLVSIARNERRPDLGVEVWCQRQVSHVLIFDAKYRTEPYDNQQTFIEDDLRKMTDYLHVIRWKTRTTRVPKPVVTSAYILYPGDVLEYDPGAPERGALPFKPELGETPRYRKIKTVLKQLLQNAEL
jgi:hypothetical protein